MTHLAHIREAIKKQYRLLCDVDGFTPEMLGDLLGYSSSDMAYKITNPNTDTLPGLASHLYASQRLTEFGNTRLARLGFVGSYVLKRMVSALTNGCFRDEYKDLNRAFLNMEDAADAADYARAESHLEELEAVLARCRSELALKKGQQTLHTL